VSASHIRRGGSEAYLDAAMDFFPAPVRERYGRGDLEKIFDTASENLPCFENLPSQIESFMPGPPDYGPEALEAIEGAGELLAALGRKFAGLEEWTGGELRAAIKETGKMTGNKGKGLYMPLRAAVTGSLHGPDLTSILVIRGREDIAGSIGAAVEAAGKRGG